MVKEHVQGKRFEQTLTKAGPTTPKALLHLCTKKRFLPEGRGWQNIWQSISFRLQYLSGALSIMMESLLHIGTEITKLTVSCMKPYMFSNLLGEWCNTFFPRAFSVFDISAFTVMSGTPRIEICSHKYFLPNCTFLIPVFVFNQENDSNSSFLKVSAEVLFDVRAATLLWKWELIFTPTMEF